MVDSTKANANDSRSDGILKRRRFLKTVGIAGTATVAGCVGGGGGKQGTIKYALPDTTYNPSKDAFKRQISTFEDETKYTVELNPIPYEGYARKIQTQLRAGSGPDVFHLDVIQMPKYASQKFLASLDYSADFDFSTSDFFKGLIRTNKWKGQLYGVPFQGGIWGVWYYNADLLEKVGIDPRNPSGAMKTWPDVIETAQRLKDETEVTAPVAMVGKAEEGLSAQWSGFYFTSNQTSWLNESKSKAIIDQNAGVKTTKFWVDLQKNGLLQDGVTSTSASSINQLWYQGDVGMWQIGSWIAGLTKSKAPDLNWGITNTPRIPGGEIGSMAGGWNHVINKNSEKKDGAKQLIQKLSTNSVLNDLVDLPPGRKKAAQTYIEGFEDGLGRDRSEILFKHYENSYPRPIHPRYPSMSNSLQKQVQKALLGQKSPSQAMATASKEINTTL